MDWIISVLCAASMAIPAAFVTPQRCQPREDMIKQLASLYGEQPMAYGVTDDEHTVMEILTTKDGSTWSVIVTGPDQSCMVLYGYGFEKRDEGRSL